jgi:KaiC/GvpD/RAD55 family RecA-like ATPase
MYKDKLSLKDFPKELQPIYSLLDNYHNTNENKADLTVADMANLLVGVSHKDKEYYLGVLENLQKLEVSADTTVKLVQRIIANKKLNEISLAAHDAKEGRVDLEQVQNLFQQFLDSQTEQKEEENDDNVFASDDLETLIQGALQTPGLRWRLTTLNQMLGSLRKGDFGFVFARPETGKTTFLASETTFMCEQLKDDDGPILWINNEEQSDKVMLRCIQAATGCTLSQLRSDQKKYSDLFKQKTKGRLKIIKDVSIVHKSYVEKLCRRYKPSLIIFDQIDKIVGFDSDREDLKLGAIYQWARELAKQYAPVIAVCQADGTGEGVKWLTMSNVANAKTSKQAEADWILGIGKVNDPGYDAIRYLHASKNKLLGDSDTLPDQRHGRRECLIRPEMARYEDIM